MLRIGTTLLCNATHRSTKEGPSATSTPCHAVQAVTLIGYFASDEFSTEARFNIYMRYV